MGLDDNSADRRMTRAARLTRRRWFEAGVGVLYIGLIASLVALSVMVYNKDFSDEVRVTVRADSVGNALQKGSDVKVRGVFVGTVRSINTHGSGADVHLDLSPGEAKQLPANVTAQLLPKTLFGERYVDLEIPAAPSAHHLRSGDVINQDRSPAAVELERLFGDLLPVLQDVQPEKLSSTLSELAAALRGRGTEIAQTLTVVSRYLGRLAPSIPTLTSDLSALANVATTYTTAAPDLLDALQSLSTTSQTLVSDRAQFEALIKDVTTTAKTVGGFVDTNSGTLIALAQNSLPSLRLLAKYSTEFPCLTNALVSYVPTADAAFGVGTSQPGGHVILHVVPVVKPYSTTDLPRYEDTAGPRCPALAGKTVAAPTPSATFSATSIGLGSVNSPAENELINELFASSAGRAPTTMPIWSSLLLGPAVRGTEVSVR
jgi:phospholipid/cholesterol/gamma-HCH transport system substrate-binding protein